MPLIYRRALLDSTNMHVYDKKDTNHAGKKYTNGKIGEVYELLCLNLKQVACFKYNFVLILLH